MGFIIILVLFIIIGIYYFNRWNYKQKFVEHEGMKLKLSWHERLYYHFILFFSISPPKEIFKALKEARRLGLSIDIYKLKGLYRTIIFELRNEIKKFNNDLLDRELRLRRFWGNYILGGTVDDLANLIKEAKEEVKPLKVKGNFKTESEKAKEKIVNNIIEEILKDPKELPKFPEKGKVPGGLFYKILKIIPLFRKQKKIIFNEPYKRFTDDLRLKLKDGKIHLSKEPLSQQLKKFIFKDTYEALYVSLQSGLDIKFRHLLSYMEKNIDFKKILELLNKLYEFDRSINLNHLERFIILKDGENEKILSSLIHATKEDIDVDLEKLWEYKLRGGNMSNMLEVYILAHRQGIKLDMADLVAQQSMIRNVEELVESLIKLRQEEIKIKPKLHEELDELGRFQDIFKAYPNENHDSENKKTDIEVKVQEVKAIAIDTKTGTPENKSSDKTQSHEPEKKNEVKENKASESEANQKKKPNIFKEKFIPYLIKASHLGLNFSLETLKSYHANGGKIEQMMDVMIQSSQANLDIDVNDCLELVHSSTDLYNLLNAMKTIKRGNLEISKMQLLNIHRAGGNILDFVLAMELSKLTGQEINPSHIEADIIEGRKVIPILYAIMYAKKDGVTIPHYGLLIKLDRNPANDVPAQIRWAVNPQIFRIDPISIVTKDAVEVKLKVNVTVRGKFMLYAQRENDDNFKNRIKEALVKEVERFNKNDDLIASLNLVAWRMFMRLNAKMDQTDFPFMEKYDVDNQNALETKLNAISAYELLDINIPNLDIERKKRFDLQEEELKLDKLHMEQHAEKQRHTAKALELEAKAKLIDSEAELNLGLSEAFKNGNLSMKDYLKKRIFDKDSSFADSFGEKH